MREQGEVHEALRLTMRPFRTPLGPQEARGERLQQSSGTPMTTRTAAETSPAGSCFFGYPGAVVYARSSARGRFRGAR